MNSVHQQLNAQEALNVEPYAARAEDARPRQTDLIRSFEILRSRRSAPYLGAER